MLVQTGSEGKRESVICVKSSCWTTRREPNFRCTVERTGGACFNEKSVKRRTRSPSLKPVREGLPDRFPLSKSAIQYREENRIGISTKKRS